MKIESADKVHYESGPNMTPLVDVVMVILIFLMLTGSFLSGVYFLQSTPTRQVGISPGPPAHLPDTQLEIRVDSYTRPGVDGLTHEAWAASAGHVTVQNDRRRLIAQLTRMHDDLNQANTPTDRVHVVINPGKNARYKHLVEVYTAAIEARFTKIAFSTAH